MRVEAITCPENSRNRPTKDQYYLGIAQAVSRRSTCLRRKYGAIVVTEYDRVISTGYNGSPSGDPNCCDIGYCYREEHNIPSGQMYEKCVAKHAESNAVMSASWREMIGATLYLYGEDREGNTLDAIPCPLCTLDIRQSGIKRVVVSQSKP